MGRARVEEATGRRLGLDALLHERHDASDFDKLRGLGELYSVTNSRHAQQYLAESYTGWDYGVDDWR